MGVIFYSNREEKKQTHFKALEASEEQNSSKRMQRTNKRHQRAPNKSFANANSKLAA